MWVAAVLGTVAVMSAIKKILSGAVVAKVASEARKPANQARAKSALRSLRSRISSRKGTAGPR